MSIPGVGTFSLPRAVWIFTTSLTVHTSYHLKTQPAVFGPLMNSPPVPWLGQITWFRGASLYSPWGGRPPPLLYAEKRAGERSWFCSFAKRGFLGWLVSWKIKQLEGIRIGRTTGSLVKHQLSPRGAGEVPAQPSVAGSIPSCPQTHSNSAITPPLKTGHLTLWLLPGLPPAAPLIQCNPQARGPGITQRPSPWAVSNVT